MSKFNFGPILERAQIIPSDTNAYDTDAIRESVSDALKVNPLIDCFYDKSEDKQYVSQMQVCFSINFELNECPKNNREINFDGAISEGPCRDGVPSYIFPIKN